MTSLGRNIGKKTYDDERKKPGKIWTNRNCHPPLDVQLWPFTKPVGERTMKKGTRARNKTRRERERRV